MDCRQIMMPANQAVGFYYDSLESVPECFMMMIAMMFSPLLSFLRKGRKSDVSNSISIMIRIMIAVMVLIIIIKRNTASASEPSS